ncbi:hypothetical protein [Streptomyces sp. NPDC046197]|uniref:hypothetical protein n=1 Tax=Streptomyces sp. NPDC046197 TaxID=3154337 RepID=UPI0033FA9442
MQVRADGDRGPDVGSLGGPAPPAMGLLDASGPVKQPRRLCRRLPVAALLVSTGLVPAPP